MTPFRIVLPLALAILALGGCEEADDVPVAVGMLQSDRVELQAEFAEPIVARHVREGESVASGGTIITQDTSRIETRLAEQRARLSGARARLAELTRGPRQEQIAAAQANVAAARQEVEFLSREYERARQVYERDLAAVETVDRAKTLLDTARSALEREAARLDELLTGTTIEELDQASATVRQMEAGLAALEIDLARHVTDAPVDGVIDSLPFETGERPQPGQPVAILLAGVQPHALAYVPESLRAGVRPGDEATVHVDGIDTPLEGRVRWVASDAAFTPYFALTRHDRGRLTYAAKIDISYDNGRLPDGVPVEVEFLPTAAP